MGYSERSLRRLVDKIQDGSVNDAVNHVLHPAVLLRNNAVGPERRAEDADNMIDVQEDTMFVQDDNHSSVSPETEQDYDVHESTFGDTEPCCMREELYDTIGNHGLPDQANQHQNDMGDFGLAEICTYQLITFLDDAKAPRNCYDRLIALLKRQHKMGFSIADAIGRDTFLKSLKKKFQSPVVKSVTVGTSPVFKFPFVHMLQNLLDDVGPDLHLINPNSIAFTGSSDELWNTR